MLYILNPFNWNWYMSDLTGLGGIGLAFSVVVILCLRYPRIRTILMLGFMARCAGAIFHHYIRPLPDAGDDAVAFETRAWEWSQNGLSEALASIGEQGMSWMYSHVGSFFYVAIGRSELFLQSLSIIAGMLTIVITWRLAQLLWDDEVFARKAAWVAALFPTLMLYSSVTMREPFIVLFFMIGLWFTVRWAQSGHYRYAALAVAFFFFEVFLHAGMVLAGLVLLGVIAWEVTSSFLVRLGQGYLRIIPAVLISTAVIVLSVFWYAFIGLSIPYIGTLTGIFDVAVILRQASTVAVEAGSQWPGFLLPTTLGGVLVVTPLRVLYFLFSPFPWDIRSATHVIGLVDAVAYMVIVAAIWRNRAALVTNRAARVILLMMVPVILAFAWGTGNAGTAVRHRSKMVLALVMLAGHYLPRIRFGRK